MQYLPFAQEGLKSCWLSGSRDMLSVQVARSRRWGKQTRMILHKQDAATAVHRQRRLVLIPALAQGLAAVSLSVHRQGNQLHKVLIHKTNPDPQAPALLEGT